MVCQHKQWYVNANNGMLTQIMVCQHKQWFSGMLTHVIQFFLILRSVSPNCVKNIISILQQQKSRAWLVHPRDEHFQVGKPKLSKKYSSDVTACSSKVMLVCAFWKIISVYNILKKWDVNPQFSLTKLNFLVVIDEALFPFYLL